MRAWLALKAAGYSFEETVVDIRRPQRFLNLAQIGRFSPSSSVPVLDTGTTIIFDSLAIMEFANDISNGSLLPEELEDRGRARSLIAWHHAGLSSICSRISFESAFYPFKRALSEDERSEAHRLFDTYEDALSNSHGPFLFKDFSLADCMHAPTAIRLFRHAPDFTAHPLTAHWMQSLTEHELVAEWLSEADTLPHIWYDDYLLKGIPEAAQFIDCEEPRRLRHS